MSARAKSCLIIPVLLAMLLLVNCGAVAGNAANGVGGGQPVGAAGLTTTTTLQAETGNNTSTSDAFQGRTNGLPRPGNVSKQDTRTMLYGGSTTRIFAHLLGWFGEAGHMDVGYHSDDPQQVRRQVEDMQSRGIQGAILDWFGPNENVVNGTALALRSQAEAHPGFQFAIMVDSGALFTAARANACDVTAQVISDLNYINTQFVPSPAYQRQNGRPVIYFFGVDANYIDWKKVTAAVTNNPILLFRGTDGLTRPISDGGFQWLDIAGNPFHPSSDNPFDPSLSQQNAFYASAKSSPRLGVGSTYKGFNDSLAPWGINRFMQHRCGQTWLETFSAIGNFYSTSNQLPVLQIVTWNDYDEGSAIEPGIDNCVNVLPAISGNRLSWSIAGGNENTIDHYTVFASTDGQNLARVADVPAGTHSLDLSRFSLSSGTFQLFVKAVGKPGIRNQMSPAVGFRAGDQSPKVRLAVSQTGPLTFRASTQGSTDPDGSIAGATIDFGDGTVVPAATANHTYAQVGSFNITAKVVDNVGASAVAVQRVSAKAVAPGVTIFSPTQGSVLNWPDSTVVASANGASPIVLMRVLVDGTQMYAIDQDTVNTVLKIYTGNRHVEVQAMDSRGAISSAAVNVTAEPGDVPPTPAIQVTPLPQVAPNTLLFCGVNWQDPDRFVNAYQWTFSDGGAPAFIPGPVHTFPTSGNFSVTQTIINEFGSTNTITQSVTVSASMPSAATGSAVHGQSREVQRQGVLNRQQK